MKIENAGIAAAGPLVPVRAGRYYWSLRMFFLLVVLASIWIPHFLHFRIDRSPVDEKNALTLAHMPSPEVLDEISNMPLGVELDVPTAKLVEVAEGILAGSLNVNRFMEAPLPLRGYPDDYKVGPSTLQLIMASLEVERILVLAFEGTHDQRFLDLAIRRTIAFAEYEEGRRQGDGFLWNDHAIAARISVLTRLWRHMRASPDFHAGKARSIFSLVERSGRLLAKPSHFTVRTNHGVVQNLALLQIAAGFPALAESADWRRLAVQRLNLQLPFYVSVEGVILEHSADYHYFGTDLLAMAVRLNVLNGLDPGPSLMDAAKKSASVLDRLMRPNGTLPVLGNTSGGIQHASIVGDHGGTTAIQHSLPPHSAPLVGNSLYPVAGYAIWWQEDTSKKLAQTLITWAKHDGHGHKHADEGSVLFWQDGIDWITNTGYWPYDAPYGEGAYSWTGSNAPHQPGERFEVSRMAKLLKTGQTAGVSFIEVERKNENGGLFRRQVLKLDANTMIVLDFARGVSLGTETIWTIDPSLRLLPSSLENTFISSSTQDGRHLSVSLASAASATQQILRGSTQPFAGWVVVNHRPTAADALRIVDQAPNSTAAVIFRVENEPQSQPHTIAIQTGATADQWEILIEDQGKPIRLSRRGSSIEIDHLPSSQSAASSVSMQLLPAPDVSAEIAAMKAAYSTAVNLYPKWRDLSFYRLRLTYALLILALSIEVGWFATSKVLNGKSRAATPYAHVVMAMGWSMIAAWTFLYYLR